MVMVLHIRRRRGLLLKLLFSPILVDSYLFPLLKCVNYTFYCNSLNSVRIPGLLYRYSFYPVLLPLLDVLLCVTKMRYIKTLFNTTSFSLSI